LSERLRILKLLEEGKINAEEAARLLEALNGGESRKRHGPPHAFSFWHTMDSIPEMVTSAIHGAFGHASAEETLKFSKKQKLELKGVSGDIDISGKDTDIITIEKDGFVGVNESPDTLQIKALSGNLEITVPKAINLGIKGVSGDLNIAHVNGIIEIATVSADICGKDLSGSLKADIVSGDVELEYSMIDKIEIKEKTGDVSITISKDTEAEIEVETREGEIDCEFELKDAVEKNGYLKGTINKPGGKIFIRNEYGDVAIQKK